ncbi:unnamed protein product [Amaranthus hypochondriacus]
MGSSQNEISSSSSFPGFQKFDPKEEYVPLRRALSRLQRRAPRPLQLKPSVSFKSEGTPKLLGHSTSSSSSSTVVVASSLNSFYQNKDPIPLLSPLVSPSFLDKYSFIHNHNNI